MDYRLIKISDEDAKTILPPRVCGILKNYGAIALGAIDCNEVVAIAVLAPSTDIERSYILHHISILEDDDQDFEEEYKEDIMKGLIDYIESLCKESNIDTLICRLVGDIQTLYPIHYFLEDAGYESISSGGHLMIYGYDKLVNSNLNNLLWKMSDIIKKVKKYDEVNKEQILNLRKKIAKMSKYDSLRVPDHKFGRFFVEDDKIKGYMDMKEIAPGMLFLSSIYVENKDISKQAIAGMFASELLAIKKSGNRDTILAIQLYSEGIYSGIKNSFGEPYMEDYILEYAKIL